MAKRIGKAQALELMRNNKGHYYTVEFLKEDNTLRVLNGQFHSVDELGYMKMRECSKLRKGKRAFRNVRILGIKKLKIAKQEYNVV